MSLEKNLSNILILKKEQTIFGINSGFRVALLVALLDWVKHQNRWTSETTSMIEYSSFGTKTESHNHNYAGTVYPLYTNRFLLLV